MKLFPLWINLLCFPLFLFGKAKIEIILDKSDGIIKPFGVTFDEQGNSYIAEFEGERVRKLQADGQLITISGTGQKGFSGEGVDASKAVYNGMHNIVRASNRGRNQPYFHSGWNTSKKRLFWRWRAGKKSNAIKPYFD